MTRTIPQNPLVAIIGATGTGKSDLAVSLAKRYNGEIVNGDAMQLYAGLPIITNKITVQEQQGIPHHLLGCIGLEEQTWVVGTFVQRALEVIEGIRERGRLPILVGGTHYYTQSLLFHDRLAGGVDSEDGKDVATESERKEWPMLQEPTEVLLEELKKVDPVMAGRWHPNDRRKIQRSLEIYLRTGKKASDLYAEQRLRKTALSHRAGNEGDGDGDVDLSSSSIMRFPTLIFWVHAEAEALRERLDSRVEKMLAVGLLDEVRTLNAFAQAQEGQNRPVDDTRGIWVSIGYKEFKSYVDALESGRTADPELEKLKAEAVDRTKAATRQYAKRQMRWIRIKFINSLAEADAADKLYLLDGSDASSFEQNVVQPASEMTQQFLQACSMPDPTSTSALAATQLVPKRSYDLSAAPKRWTKQHCEVCDVTCVIEDQWVQHVKSRTHRRLVSKRKQLSVPHGLGGDGEKSTTYCEGISTPGEG